MILDYYISNAYSKVVDELFTSGLELDYETTYKRNDKTDLINRTCYTLFFNKNIEITLGINNIKHIRRGNHVVFNMRPGFFGLLHLNAFTKYIKDYTIANQDITMLDIME